MIARIVVANQYEARFYDAAGPKAPLRAAGRLLNPDARLHDRDLKSDRPGRVFAPASAGPGRRGAAVHHAVGGKQRPQRQVAVAFARRVAAELAAAKKRREFDRLVLIVAPMFLGILRTALPKSLRSAVAAEVAKDLPRQTKKEIRAHVPLPALQTVR